jgi:hypothetical protein
MASGATRVVAYDEVPKWGTSMTKQAHAVIDLVGGPISESQGAAALRNGGYFVTLVGPMVCMHIPCEIEEVASRVSLSVD